MSRSGVRRLAALLGFVLAALGETAWAQWFEQPEQPFSLTGRMLFGYADLEQISLHQSGPAALLTADASGYWRDPRIFEFDVKPIATLGDAIPGTEIGSAFTGGSATGLILQGSSFPLALSYSRTTSSFGEDYKSDPITNPNQDVLNGVEDRLTNSLFDARWTLRFPDWPLVTFDYRDMDANSPLPTTLGGEEDHHSHDFLTNINYNKAGWLLAGRYVHNQFKTTAPDILEGGELSDSGTASDLGFTASRLLPLNSTVAVSADDTKSNYSIEGVETNLSARTANASLTSQPLARLTAFLQTLYTSNMQASEVQQALAGAGVPGSVSPFTATASTAPLTYMAAPYHVLTAIGGAAYRLGRGFTVNGSVGDSHESLNSGTSFQWSAGLNYTRKWRSGWLSTDYAHSQFSSEVEVANGTIAGGSGSTSQNTSSLFTQHIDVNSGNLNLTQRLPRQFQLLAAGHLSGGTLTEYATPYPYHAYGGLANLTRPVGQWTLTSSFDLEEVTTDAPGTYNRSKSESASLTAAYRGLNLSGGYLYGSGLAMQVGNSLVYVNQPVGPVLGAPVLSSTRGTDLIGSYRSRRGRWMLSGYWYRYNYSIVAVPTSQFNMYNFHASYKLRRLRLIAGFVKQSQELGLEQSNTFGSRLMYFQVERVFRIY